MEVIKCWEEEGVTIPQPNYRHIKVMLASDIRDTPELLFSQAIIYQDGQTEEHSHDRPELIQVLSGRGISKSAEGEVALEPDMVLWVRPGEVHQIVNPYPEPLKLSAIFVPAFEAKKHLQRIKEAAEQDGDKKG
jgi:mannose-6-phosphate isomerase-like protein (cupin superfamily)